MKKIIILLIFLFWASIAEAQITFDAVTAQLVAGPSTTTFAHTVGTPCVNPVIVVCVQWFSIPSFENISSLVIAGNFGTLVAGQQITGLRWRSEIWTGVSGVSSGSNTIHLDWDGGVTAGQVVAVSYCGVDQTTPTGTPATAEGTDDPITVDVSSAAGEIVVDSVVVKANSAFNSLGVGAGQTVRDGGSAPLDGGGDILQGVSEESGAGTVTMSWTEGDTPVPWATVAVALKPATAIKRAPMLIIVE